MRQEAVVYFDRDLYGKFEMSLITLTIKAVDNQVFQVTELTREMIIDNF